MIDEEKARLDELESGPDECYRQMCAVVYVLLLTALALIVGVVLAARQLLGA